MTQGFFINILLGYRACICRESFFHSPPTFLPLRTSPSVPGVVTYLRHFLPVFFPTRAESRRVPPSPLKEDFPLAILITIPSVRPPPLVVRYGRCNYLRLIRPCILFQRPLLPVIFLDLILGRPSNAKGSVVPPSSEFHPFSLSPLVQFLFTARSLPPTKCHQVLLEPPFFPASPSLSPSVFLETKSPPLP